MTEQEFRELTAYPPPTPPKQSPPVSSIASAVANKGTGGAVPSIPPSPPVPQIPMPGIPMPPQAQKAVQADVLQQAAEYSSQNKLFSQFPQMPVNNAPPVSPAPTAEPTHASVSSSALNDALQELAAPVQASMPVQASAPVTAPTSVPARAPESNKIVPVEKHHELVEQFTQLSDRHKRILAERDALAKQVTELKRALAERPEEGNRDYKEEIRLLGKLIDSEQSLRKAVADSGAYKPGEDPYARHDKLVQVFLNIVDRI